MICASCALFGKHKSHKVREEKELAIDTQSLADEIHELQECLREEEIKAKANGAVKAWTQKLLKEKESKEAEIQEYFEVGQSCNLGMETENTGFGRTCTQ